MEGNQECYQLGWFRLQGTEILTNRLIELSHVTGNVGVGWVLKLIVLRVSELFSTLLAPESTLS